VICFFGTIFKFVPIFAVIVHHNPVALRAHLDRLRDYPLIVRLNRSSSRTQFNFVQEYENVYFIPKVNSIKVNWGSFYQLKTQFELIKHKLRFEAMEWPLVLILGECYPIKPLAQFEAQLRTNKNLMSISRMEPNKSRGKDTSKIARMNRVAKFHYQDFRVLRKTINRKFFCFG
jgi:hypothetical protein